ncbi:MAG: hypothetical protein MJZ86_05755 [Bacteroidales bacterium]|nr:hypothetical protein [Bacteroidales bacterium]
MKKVLFVAMMLGMGFCAMAQQPTVSGETKVTYSTESGMGKRANQNEKIHCTPDTYMLKPGADNMVKFSVDGVRDNNLLVKVVTEDLCKGRKGEQFGEYIFTPTAKEGKVIVRVGAMDFMGAYLKYGEIEFTIGEPAEAKPVEEEVKAVEAE